MSQRESNLIWLKDMLDHLRSCQQELQWTDNADTLTVLTDSMLRDLERCRRLCEGLRRRSHLQHVG